MAESPKENHEINAESKTSTLNVLCAICSEFFINTDIIFSTTKCGHVFHRTCLFRWLKRSNTCPQCRACVHQHNVHRLYLNFSQPTELDDMEMDTIKSFEWLYMLEDSVTPEELSRFGLNIGFDKEGDPIYAARVYLEDDLLPAYYVPKKKGVYAAWNCKSHFLTDGIEILHINNDNAEYKWVAANNGEIPDNALPSGYCENGETLYTAKAKYEGRIRCGKLHPSHGCAYLPYKSKEVSNKNYEILTRVVKSKE